MLIATVFSLAYALRFISKVFLGQPMDEHGVGESEATASEPGHEKHRIVDVPNYMKFSLAILVVLVVLIGIYPTFFINLIQTVTFGGPI